jgi:hypothetical protein
LGGSSRPPSVHTQAEKLAQQAESKKALSRYSSLIGQCDMIKVGVDGTVDSDGTVVAGDTPWLKEWRGK